MRGSGSDERQMRLAELVRNHPSLAVEDQGIDTSANCRRRHRPPFGNVRALRFERHQEEADFSVCPIDKRDERIAYRMKRPPALRARSERPADFLAAMQRFAVPMPDAIVREQRYRPFVRMLVETSKELEYGFGA